MTAPPTITTGTATLDATLTKNVYAQSFPGSFKLRGGSPHDHSVYKTFPSVTLPTGTGNVGGDATKNSYGAAAEFLCDAPKVQIVALGSVNTVMFEVDGVSVSATPTPFANSGGTNYFLLDFTSAGGRAVRRFRVEGSQFEFRGVQVGPTYNVWAPADSDSLLVANVGDSVSAQTGATTPNGGFNTRLGKLLGWTDVWQVALGGTGFIATGTYASTFGDATRVADVVAANPDLVYICGSQNDTGSSASALTAAALACFQAYRAALPKVPIVVSGIYASTTGPNAAVTTAEGAILSAFTSWADPNSWFIPVSTDATGAWIYGTGTAATRTVADGVLNSTTTVTSATAAFTTADVGCYITGTGIPANTKISTRVSATQITLSAAATATASGVSLTITGQKGDGNGDYYNSGTQVSHPSEEGHLYLARRHAAAFRTLVLPNLS